MNRGFVMKQMTMALWWPKKRDSKFLNGWIKIVNFKAYVKIITQNQNVQNLRKCASKVDCEKNVSSLWDEPQLHTRQHFWLHE